MMNDDCRCVKLPHRLQILHSTAPNSAKTRKNRRVSRGSDALRSHGQNRLGWKSRGEYEMMIERDEVPSLSGFIAHRRSVPIFVP